jgi:xanthine dehydrogenase accessory factor
MARIAGYDMEIIDPRTAFATPERFPDVPLFADWPETVLKDRPFDAYTAVAAVTHDPKIDDFALKAALDANCFYVGALGSRKTHARRVERLTAMGTSDAALARIRSPIGLDIGAASPAEIAVAVLAQVIAAFRSRDLTQEAEGRAA